MDSGQKDKAAIVAGGSRGIGAAAEYAPGVQLNVDGGGEGPLFLDLIKGE